MKRKGKPFFGSEKREAGSRNLDGLDKLGRANQETKIVIRRGNGAGRRFGPRKRNGWMKLGHLESESSRVKAKGKQIGFDLGRRVNMAEFGR